MSSLIETLPHASIAERQAVASELVHGMLGLEGTANSTFRTLCQQVVAQVVGPQVPGKKIPLQTRGEFRPYGSAGFVTHVPRVSGYLRAIQRADQAESAAEAGCGSSAVLAIATAEFHPRAEVAAYEVNAHAAESAARVVELLGLSERVHVIHANVFDTDLPTVDLGVTETFQAALFREPGVQISERLAKFARTILPAHIILGARDTGLDSPEPWQVATRIDLSAHNPMIVGKISSTDSGLRTVLAYASYYDARGHAVLATRGVDAITSSDEIGEVLVNQAGDPIHFCYQPGMIDGIDHAILWSIPREQ